MKRADLTGRVFGHLTAIEFAASKPTRWLCRCDCGTTKVIRANELIQGGSKSCGCKTSEMCSRANKTHGMSRTKVYDVWCKMIERCHKPKSKDFYLYGERGIIVCDRWRNSFEAFIADMGEPPPKHLIDRIDGDGPYCPENCRWTDAKTSSRNRRGRLLITAFGETKCATAWVDDPRCLATFSALAQRIRQLGWPAEKAITTPSNRRNRINT